MVFCEILLFVLVHNADVQAAVKSGKEPQKKAGTSKITIEHISFPDVFAKYDAYPWEMPAMEEFRAAYAGMLGSRTYDEWIGTLTGTGNKNKMLYAFQKHFVMIALCRPHFCDTSQILILFDPLVKKCYAIYAKDGKFEYPGPSDETMKSLLKILLVDEYKEIYKGQ